MQKVATVACSRQKVNQYFDRLDVLFKELLKDWILKNPNCEVKSHSFNFFDRKDDGGIGPFGSSLILTIVYGETKQLPPDAL